MSCLSPVQRSPSDCGVSECDREVRNLRPSRFYRATNNTAADEFVCYLTTLYQICELFTVIQTCVISVTILQLPTERTNFEDKLLLSGQQMLPASIDMIVSRIGSPKYCQCFYCSLWKVFCGSYFCFLLNLCARQHTLFSLDV